ncbi:MAG: hypothetical protein OXD43_00185 [Bacteroidetes bacterium]|nr:hypothetical protein [Bacteroidota bacterium]
MCIILYNNLQAEDFEAYLHWMPDDTQVVKQLSDIPNGKAWAGQKERLSKTYSTSRGKQASRNP